MNDYWLGNVGALTLTFVLIYYFSKKGKLGYIGKLIMQKIDKIKTSRRFKIVFVANILMIFVCVSFIVLLHVGEQSHNVYHIESDLESKGIVNFEDVYEYEGGDHC